MLIKRGGGNNVEDFKTKKVFNAVRELKLKEIKSERSGTTTLFHFY